MNNEDNSRGLEKKTRLVGIIERFLERWAHFVANNSILLIIICVILTLIGTFKVATTPNENDITGYTPYGARARDEFGVMTDFFAHNGNGIAMFLLILPTRHSNVLHSSVLKEALRVETILSTSFQIPTILENGTARLQSYNEYCTNFCQINEPFVQFANSFIAEEMNMRNGSAISDRLRLHYPITTIFSRKMSIQPNFFGIQINEHGNQSFTNLKSSKMIALQIRSERKAGWNSQMIKEYEMSISNYFDYEFTSDQVRVLTLSTSNVEAEVVRAGMSLLPFLIVGFTIMAIISSFTTFISAFYMQQVSIHKFTLAIAACICPFMACGTALGALFFCGVRFGSILCVTPFLVLAIGVDDAYLMIHAWQRVKAERVEGGGCVDGDSVGGRLAEVFIDTGPAILISAMTNIFADVAGCFTSSPEITLLAYGNMACIFCDFIYQITFYAAIMTIAGKFEMENENQKRHVKRITCGMEIEDRFESSSIRSFEDEVKQKVSKYLEIYLSIITHVIFQIIVFTAWMIFLAISIYGISVMNINLSPKKLFMEDSSLREMDDLRVKYVVPHFYVANVFVTRPGDLGNLERFEKLNRFVNEMENLNGSWGPQGTNYFVRDMIEFQNAMREEEGGEEDGGVADNSTGLAIQNLPLFLEWPEYTFWRGFVQFHSKNGIVVLDKFFMTFAIHGKNLQSWPARGDALRAWREVVDKYKGDFGLSVYSDDGIYVDLIENMPTDAWQSAVATIACMAFICFIFMFNIPTVIVATMIISSIMTGILGILSLTGTDLDPIVMSALIISIGFSVDIPAHISYHYHTSSSFFEIRDRLRLTLASVGFPALQASISTSLCVLSLKFTSVYMSNVFVKTMILCMILCVIHSLILLPTIFAIFHRIFRSSKIAPNESKL